MESLGTELGSTMPKTPTPKAPKMLWRLRFLKFVGVVLLIVVAVLYFIVRHIAPPMIVEPPRSGERAHTPADFVFRTFRVDDQINLAAWQNIPQGKPIAIIIVLHGIADSKASQEGTLRSLAEQNILAIAPDLRAHGQSSGLASYGFHEKQDLSLIIDDLRREFPTISIGLWGTSYGGAVALQTAAHDSRVHFAIIESTFANLPDMARQQVANFASPLLGWLAPFALSRAGELAAFPPSQVLPEQAISATQIPILHFHGTADDVIPFNHGARISQQINRPNYRFVPIHGGGHYSLQQTDPGTYRSELQSFFDSVIQRESPSLPTQSLEAE